MRRKGNGVSVPSMFGPVSHGRHLSRWFSVVLPKRAMQSSVRRDGVRVSLFTQIQNPSVSMRPPADPCSCTRMLHHLVESAAHHR
ncbi:Uncharacterised protein [Mycobacterium tuberculosis]|nr:Uncharacterised protein [Mycobacterium tuberculosis]